MHIQINFKATRFTRAGSIYARTTAPIHDGYDAKGTSKFRYVFCPMFSAVAHTTPGDAVAGVDMIILRLRRVGGYGFFTRLAYGSFAA